MSDCCKGTACEVREPKARRPALARCPECGRKGKSVDHITLEHLLFDPLVQTLGQDTYFFCATPACGTVYYSGAVAARSFRKDDLKVRVGIKETEDPIPLCYCFGHTRGSVWAEIEKTGRSTALDSIRSEIQAGRCECEIKNPSGKCCLGDVTIAVWERQGVQVGAGFKG